MTDTSANNNVITTPRLILRAITLNDAAAIFSMRSDAEVMRFIPRPRAVKMEDVTSLISVMEKGDRENTSRNWAITLKDDDRLIGYIGFVSIRPDDFRAEIGYMLAPVHHGKGIMTEAIRAVTAYGFSHMGLHTIQAVTDPANHASISALIKCGFEKEGHLKENIFFEGQFLDSVYFTLFNK